MASDQRQTAGENNKKGNRFEDCFAVCRCLKVSRDAIESGVEVSLTEQAGCPVDDLLIRRGEERHYYQLKDDLKITWGESNSKLEREFVQQLAECEARAENFGLHLIVSHDHRQRSLSKHIPVSLSGKVSIGVFPALDRPSNLARLAELRPHLAWLSASRNPGMELLMALVEGMYIAWIERCINEGGSSDLKKMIEWLWDRPAHRLRRTVPEGIHPRWSEVERVLATIPGLEWFTDRGFFEWVCGRDSGLVPSPLNDPGFLRLVERICAATPQVFEDFEVLL